MKSLKKAFCLALLLTSAAFALSQPPLYLFFPDTFENGCISYKASCFGKESADQFTKIKPEGTTPLPLLTDGQKAYLKMPRTERIAYFADKECRNAMRSLGYYPLTVTLEWKCTAENIKMQRVAISENPFMDAAVIVPVKGTDSRIELNNLKIAQKYYWQVFAMTENGGIRSAIYSFETEADSPRLLKIPGVPNVRDLGGRIGLDGRRIRQGMIIRTAGLNENASSIVYPVETLQKDHPAIYEKITQIDARMAAIQKDIEENKEIGYLPYPISKQWTVFLPKEATTGEQRQEFLALSSIPDEFLGVKGVRMTADENGKISFENPTDYRPALFIQEFDSSEEGYVQMGCGADWFWTLSVNGQTIIDRYTTGNGGSPVSINNYTIEFPVKKGKNLIAVAIGSGSGGWCLCTGVPTSPVSHVAICKQELGILKASHKDLLTDPDRRNPGRNRLTPIYQEYMTDFLGIRSDIDLRSGTECYGMTGSPMGPKAYWFNYSSACYGGMKSFYGRNTFAKVFQVFLNRNNYPIDFHCIAGQDRTGAVAFIINGLLGVSEEELYLDWETTGFWNGSISFNHERLFNHLVHAFDDQPGENINKRLENYVLSLGFTMDDIQYLRDLMLE